MKSSRPPTHGTTGFRRLLLAALLLLLASPSLRAFDPVFYDPDTSTDPNAPSYWSQISAHGPTMESRTCAQYVIEEYAKLAFNKTTTVSNDIAGNILTALTDLQYMQDLTTSPSKDATYGNFAWELSAVTVDPTTKVKTVTVHDPNAGEFVVQALAQVPLRFAALENATTYVDPTTHASTPIAPLINTILTNAQAGIEAHSVPYTYTNIAITKSWNLIALGQALSNNATTLQDGRVFFNNWLNQVQATGISEFLSPTYYAADMDSLGFICLYAQDQGLRSQAQQAMRLYWIDLLANYMNQNQHMGGAHSRTYNFLLDTGSTDRYYYQAGLLTARTPHYWHGMTSPNTSLTVPADVLNASRTYPLLVLRDFNQNKTGVPQFATNYISDNPKTAAQAFSVGSLTTFYNDVTAESLTITLPPTTPKQTPEINYNMEGMSNPYLALTTPDAAGVPKADTLRPFVASVQRGPEVLFIASANGLDRSSSATSPYDTAPDCMESSLVFPDEAAIYLGSSTSPLVMKQGDIHSITVGTGGTAVFFLLNNVATAVRVLQATDMSDSTTAVDVAIHADGYSAPDGDGNVTAYDAKRLTAVHLNQSPANKPGRATIALWTRTQAVSSTAGSNDFSHFQSAFLTSSVQTNSLTSGVATLAVTGLPVNGKANTLSVSADVGKETLKSTAGGEPNLTSSLLNIGGTEYVTQTLQEWLFQDIIPVTNPATQTATGNTATDDTTGLFTVNGAGTDIWDNQDCFQFAYERLSGDGSIIAHMSSLPSGVDEWAKAGIMFRDSLDAGAPNAFACLTGSHGQRFSYRPSANAASLRNGNSTLTSPLWLKITRVGNTFTAYSSTSSQTSLALDDASWVPIYSTTPAQTFTMQANAFVGLAVTSKNPGSLMQVTFDNVGVFPATTPNP